MRVQFLWREVHYWLSVIAAPPLLVIIGTGLVLHVKKDFHWIQPEEQRGAGGVPSVSFDQILDACRALPEVSVDGWDDVQRVDLRPDSALLKVTTRQGWEVQLDSADGRVLQVARRRSDLFESLHDGSWFGDAAKRWVFLPAGAVLLILWLTGIYLFLLPFLRHSGRARVDAPAAD